MLVDRSNAKSEFSGRVTSNFAGGVDAQIAAQSVDVQEPAISTCRFDDNDLLPWKPSAAQFRMDPDYRFGRWSNY